MMAASGMSLRSSISSEKGFVSSTSNEKEAREAYNAERGIATFVCKYSCKRLVSHKVV